MRSDAIYNCCRYSHNFNPMESNNPFAYLTTVIINSFIARINKEKTIHSRSEFIRDTIFNEFMVKFGIVHAVDDDKQGDYD